MDLFLWLIVAPSSVEARQLAAQYPCQEKIRFYSNI
ncbi:hypothetical protein AvCA_43840 [Azotobacter vinelandii CA]|uniref:Uncharacterized protein n=2 Tax=Azotobacter vinelandii TaxID=354 RepID=C1DGK9_AZOVD|nr:hypothetical protein Avin_43840 [Azotobacter vinelandii DJ]AGK14382.1 hypothetical protein AvCA_43840 [Azotobacter vinelandii CA]AGK21959.1 hypothetical protein AvCA6_43840 [Azotobacter vinelandii CA6]